jgi:hypothetical protein
MDTSNYFKYATKRKTSSLEPVMLMGCGKKRDLTSLGSMKSMEAFSIFNVIGARLSLKEEILSLILITRLSCLIHCLAVIAVIIFFAQTSFFGTISNTLKKEQKSKRRGTRSLNGTSTTEIRALLSLKSELGRTTKLLGV